SLEGIEAYIQRVVQEWRVPGVGIGVIKDGEILLVPLTHPLSAYAGDYVHPGFGTFSIVQEREGLHGLFNEKEFVFKHLYYNIFQASLEIFDFHCKLAFSINPKGEIASFSIGLEPEAKPLVFMR